eukprot:3055312-Amphidinium_carterae.1
MEAGVEISAILCHYLLAHKAEPSLQDSRGCTVLHQAVHSRRNQLCRVLVEEELFTAWQIQDPQGETALHAAANQENAEACELLAQDRRFQAWGAQDCQGAT